MHGAPGLSAAGGPLALALWEDWHLDLPMPKGKIPASRDQCRQALIVHIMQSSLLSSL